MVPKDQELLGWSELVFGLNFPMLSCEGMEAVSLAGTCTESFPTFLLITGSSEVTVRRKK